MRYYSLQVLGTGFNYKLDSDNPFGLDVVFRIQSTSSVLAALPSTFEIINGDIELFSETKELVGSRVIFNAGIASAPYLKHQNIIPTVNLTPLFFAQVDASFASWELTENRCVLAFSSCRPMPMDNAFVLNKGDMVASVAAKYLERNLLRNDYTATVLIANNALNVSYDNEGSIPFQFAKGGDNNLILKLAQFLRQFKLDIDYQASINTYTIYSIDSGLTDTSVTGDIVILNPTCLLSQPVWENASKVTLEMILDPRVTLGSKLFLPTNIELFSDTSGFGNTILKSAVDARILKNGYYKVVEVMHIGDSRNTDPKSWSTVCKCVFSI